MKITKVQVKKFESETSNVKAFVEVTLDGCFVVKDIRVIEKPDKMVVAMPSRTINVVNPENVNEEIRVHKDLAHPINRETREMFNSTILGVYERANANEYIEEFND